jgi:peptidyl-tRNA hydrolase
MDASIARNVAHYSHVGQRTRFDELVVEHVERVAARVESEAQSIAYLHDVVEHTGTPITELREAGLTPLEAEALELLTRAPDEPFEAHVLRIAHARGPAGDLARAVKLADLDDHLAHTQIPDGAPAYAWARRHIANGTTAGQQRRTHA